MIILFFFKEYGEAEKVLAKLQTILSDYELALNREKTNIYEMPQSIEPTWISEINNMKLDNENIISFISNVYALIRRNPNEEVVRYSFSKLRKIKIKKANWNLVESFILSSILYDPSAIPYGCSILSEYYYKRFGIDKRRVKVTAKSIIERALLSKNEYEIVWALWLTNLLKVDLDDSTCISICQMDSPTIALIMLHLFPKSKLDTSKWEEFMTKDNLYTEYWLLAYEALVRNWLPSKNGDDYVENDNFYRLLKKNHVRFLILLVGITGFTTILMKNGYQISHLYFR